MDKLEQFIIQNKDRMEADRQPEAGWEAVQKRLERQERGRDHLVYWKVAAVVFMASTLLLGALQFSDSDQAKAVVAADDIESYYVQQINLKMQEFSALAGEPQVEDLFRDLEKMDQAYKDLKASFDQYESEEMADAMIENLRLRVIILNEQIELLKRGKTVEEAYHSS